MNKPADPNPAPEQVNVAALKKLNLAQKVRLLYGELPFWSGLARMVAGAYGKQTWNSPSADTLNYPGIRFADGPRGVVLEGCTTFPVPMARGASWNPALERQIGAAMGAELRALGGNLFGGVCINLVRHPAWGRAQESYGEDPFHLSAFATAVTTGVQQHVMACVKHFALNSMENARFSVDVSVNKRVLHEVYLPHFKAAINAGAHSVMSAYNSVNGNWCGHNFVLLTDILKQRWGFSGFVITDFIFGIRDSAAAINAGVDLEMPFHMHFHQSLAKDVAQMRVPVARVDDALMRLANSYESHVKTRIKAEPSVEVVGCEKHQALALESARQSIVMLKNSTTLPLIRPKRIVVLGHLANIANTGDRGSSNTRPKSVITPLAGLQQHAPVGTQIQFDDASNLARAVALCQDADAVIVVVGYTFEDEGEFISPAPAANMRALFPKPRTLSELYCAFKVKRGLNKNRKTGGSFAAGGDRESLALRASDEALILAVAAALGNRAQHALTIVVMAGSAVEMETWQGKVGAILMLWYPGMQGGLALAEIIFGKTNPSGRLPISFAKSGADLPFFDRHANQIEYGLLHGYRQLARDGKSAAFPFGFGLSYCEFDITALRLSTNATSIEADIDVRNRSAISGVCVLQLYMAVANSLVPRAPIELKGFTRVNLLSMNQETIRISVPIHTLRYFCETADDFVLEPARYTLIAAQHAEDSKARRADFVVNQQGDCYVNNEVF